jgi:hypothetical protein
MKPLRTVVFLCMVAVGATPAWAQLGLYGSPELLEFPQAARAPVLPGGYATPPAYPAAAPAPTTWTVPAAAPYASRRPLPPTPSSPAAGASQWAQIPADPAPPTPPYWNGNLPTANAPAEAPSVVQQMLSEAEAQQPAADPASGVSDQGQYGPLTAAVNGFEQACLGGCGGGWAARSCCPWYASANALVMTRNDANRVWTSYEWGNEANQWCNTRISMRWKWGGEIRFGRRFCCDRWAVEATYWALEPFEGFSECTHPNNLGTPLTVGNVLFAGNPGTDYFDNAAGHRLWRRDEVQSVELNVVRNRVLFTSDLPWEVDWLLGVRYFRFEENLIFGSVANGFTWGQDPSQEAYLNDLITNDLVGFQFGFDANYYCRRQAGWRLFVTPKFGIYHNHMEHEFRAYLGDGTVATPDPASGITGTYPVRSSKDTVSFLSQIDVGAEWQFAQRWSARVGYRLVVVSGIGLADNQIPPYIVDIPELADIDFNGELILHGGFLGLTYNF